MINLVFILGCEQQREFVKEQDSSERYIEPVTDKLEESPGSPDDILSIAVPSVIFYAPKAGELNNLPVDNATREGLIQAIGDFAYYASIVSDSLEAGQIKVYYTDKSLISLGQGKNQFSFNRGDSSSPIGMILFDGKDQYKMLPGMQTHLSLLAAITDFFYDDRSDAMPLLDYFEAADSKQLHIYSSHSDILNQVGRKIDPAYHTKFGSKLAKRAGKFHMSVFAYHKFNLKDSLTAIICRVPSTYDESSVKLYLWDESTARVINEIELAENVWNERWIVVKDSWINLQPDNKVFSIVTRKKEARMKDGNRIETDSLYQWQWTGSNFKSMPVQGLSVNDFPLQDWESYQEPKAITEITIIDEDYVWLPLETGDLTWQNIIMELPKPYSIKKEPIENQLAAHQIDTLITITRENLWLKFYQAPDDILLVNGAISDGSVSLKKGVKVGISKADFISQFDKLSTINAVPDIIKVRSKAADRIISYSFQNDTLARIEFTNFIH